MHSRVDSAVVLSSLGLFQIDRFVLSLGCVVKWTRGSSIRLVWFGSAQKVRCNSIKGSLRVALVFFIIADHESVYWEIPDEYTGSDIEHWSTFCRGRHLKVLDR